MVAKLRQSKNRHLPRQVSIATTGLTMDGCEIFLGHPDPNMAKASVPKFQNFMVATVARARAPNMSDMYDEHFQMCAGLAKGMNFGEMING